jgi:glutamyl-tRNA reductase
VNLQVIGCSHHHSSVSVREKLAFSEDQIRSFLKKFHQRYPKSEAVLLSTCNRTEFYAARRSAHGVPSSQQMIEFLADHRGLKSGEIANNLFAHQDHAAISHLFNVAASLDSMVVGEAQILSQVKQAYQLAVDTGHQIPLTHLVFQNAMKVAKRVANETDIHSTRVSVPSVAVNVLTKQIFETLADKRVLILGAGKMAEETLTYIVAGGGKDVVVTNRTRNRAQELAEKFNGQIADWSDLHHQLADADLIVSTTGASTPVVTRDKFDPVAQKRDGKPLLVLDLAIPRDFDSKIGDYENVYLYTLDDLQKECEKNRQSRQSQWPKAKKIVEQETAAFFKDMHRRNSGSTIALLKKQANEVKNLELERLLNRLDRLTPEQESEIEQSFHRLVKKLLHPPLKSINADQSSESGGLLDAMKRLFQLGD